MPPGDRVARRRAALRRTARPAATSGSGPGPARRRRDPHPPQPDRPGQRSPRGACCGSTPTTPCAPDHVLAAIVRFVAPRRAVGRAAAPAEGHARVADVLARAAATAGRARPTRSAPGDAPRCCAKLMARWHELNAQHFDGQLARDPDRPVEPDAAPAGRSLVYDRGTASRPVRDRDQPPPAAARTVARRWRRRCCTRWCTSGRRRRAPAVDHGRVPAQGARGGDRAAGRGRPDGRITGPVTPIGRPPLYFHVPKR